MGEIRLRENLDSRVGLILPGRLTYSELNLNIVTVLSLFLLA